MAYFNWTKELDVNVSTMNDQHKILIHIMEELYQLNKTREKKYKILQKLNELGSFTRKHFSDEERFMDSVDFEGGERHKIIHNHLLEELDMYTENFKYHNQSLSEDFFYFLKHWLISHIKHIDAKYGSVVPELMFVKAG